MLSFWEKESFTKYDVIIVGAGITGLSTALALKEKDVNLSVLVLEKGIFPTGASTKNAGFACVGSLTEILDDLKHLSAEEVVALVKKRKDGLDLLRRRLSDKNIGYHENGSYELLQEKELPALEELERINQLLQPLYGEAIFKEEKNLVAQFGFPDKIKSIVSSKAEGEIHTGMMMKSLLRKVQSLGVEIKTGATVTNFDEKQNEIIVTVNDSLELSATKLAICTNAFTKQLLPEIDLQPGRGQVLVTKPIANLPFKGIFHFDEGYYYFRRIGNRVLFGGGRQLNFEKETSTAFEFNQKIQNDLIEKLQTLILPNTPFEIDRQWAGIMAFGKTKQAIVKKIAPNIGVAVRLGGMGIAIGSQLGTTLAEQLMEDEV